jgi:hypothetical protein
MGSYALMVHLEWKEGESRAPDFYCCVEKEDEKQMRGGISLARIAPAHRGLISAKGYRECRADSEGARLSITWFSN